MNDNTTMHEGRWIDLVEQEWGFRPVSCEVDTRKRRVSAVFHPPLNVGGEMRICGYTIIPQAFTQAPEHPFNKERNLGGQRTHRVRTQHAL